MQINEVSLIAQRVFRVTKRSLPDVRLLPRGHGHNGHRDFAINDRVNGDVITFRVSNRQGHWHCEILTTNISRLPQVSRITRLPHDLGKFIGKNNDLGWQTKTGEQ